MMRRVDLLVALAGGILLLAACSSGGEGPSDTNDSCDPVECAAMIPEPECNGRGDAVVTSLSSLGCGPFGTCDYETSSEPCEFGCEDAACVVPCGGLTCNRPAPPYCDGNRAISEADEGRLIVNACRCRYEETVTECGDDVCVEGECVPLSCDQVTCEDPPDNECDGDFALHYESVGQCDDDTRECAYPFEVLDCPGDGMTCVDGECVDLCDGVTCDEPPDAFCTGAVATTWSETGECRLDGTCEYVAEETDCLREGASCVRGVCEPLCVDEDCAVPPPNHCAGDIAITYGEAGTCGADFLCRYSFTEQDCAPLGLVCIAGECAEEPTCVGVACDNPPDGFCDGLIAHNFRVPGVCEPGPECVFEAFSENCGLTEGEICVDGVCAAFCDTVTCDEPPANSCDGDVATQYEELGECDAVEEECTFVSTEIDCTESGARCFEGECLTGCVPELCTAPPDGLSCAGSTVIGFSDIATCTRDDECLYAPEEVEDCSPRACHVGECVPACGDGFCIEPPDASCEADVLTQYEPIGDCIGGACDYRDLRTDCEAAGFACIDDPLDGGAACRDACDGYLTCDVLPASYCVDDTLMVVSFPVECIDSECVYTETPFDCTSDGDVCSDGACVDPCVGVICDSPPADFCAGMVAVEFPSLGTCEEGECSYVPVNNDCTDLGLDCLGGECLDACADVTCDVPPEDGCDGDDLVDYEEVAGTCVVGECIWEELGRTDCTATGRNCVDGACVDLCAGVLCTTRPPRECIDDISRNFGSIGSCSFGECSYPPVDTDCQDSGRICIDGRCGGGCVPSACDASTLAECDGFTRITYAGVPPVCIEGRCHRDADSYDCLTEGATCEGGACVASDDICAEVSCAPVDVCDGNVAVSRSGSGVCVPGPPTTCDYSGVETRTTCSAPSGCFAGECVRVPQPGELVLSEIFFDALGSDEASEWVEIHNRAADEVDLSGVEVTSDRGRVTLPTGASVAAGGYFVLAASGADIGGADARFDTFHLPLANTSDTITILLAETVLDAVAYDLDALWPGGVGDALSLDPSVLTTEDNDRRFSWCGGGTGTPRSPNPSCF